MVAKSMTSKLCAQLEEQPINNSLLSNCLPASTEGLAVFSGIFAAEYWPTELLLGKPHLSKARNKTAPGTLEHSQKGTFSSVFYPVCVCVCVRLCPKGLPCFTEVDIKAHCAVPTSQGPARMHLSRHMSLFRTGNNNHDRNPSHYCCLFHRQFQNDVDFIQ